jgi:hypothetical protein
MHIESYFQSLTSELDALKNRVRQLIEDRHWQTDGEWKESVIRQMLRRQPPASASVGRGFVVDSSKPVLFRDSDLVFVTPDAVYGVIEVKSRATPRIVADAARKLAQDMVLIRQNANSGAFAGLFAFEDDGGRSSAYLESLAEAAEHWENRLDFVCSGRRRFIRYWHLEPQTERHFYEGWHSYDLPETAPGYFFHNVVDCVSPESVFSNKDVWFPRDGKEQFVDGEIFGRWPSQRLASVRVSNPT